MNTLKKIYVIYGHIAAGLVWSLLFAIISFGIFLSLGYGNSKSEAPVWFVRGSITLWIIAFIIGVWVDIRSTRGRVQNNADASVRIDRQ